jgi:hypothetical protein
MCLEIKCFQQNRRPLYFLKDWTNSKAVLGLIFSRGLLSLARVSVKTGTTDTFKGSDTKSHEAVYVFKFSTALG